MELELTQQLLTENDCYKAGRHIVPKGVMVHSTGVAQPDPEVFIRRWNAPGVEKCVHAFLSRDRAVQTLPWTMRGWHAGVGTSGRSANNTHLSFECCEPAGHTYQGGEMVGYDVAANQPYFDDIYRNAVQLTALLCKEFSLDPLEPGVVICHAEGYDLGVAVNHSDVLQWWPKHGATMDQFRRDVDQAMRDEEDDDMTQERFDAMLEDYLARQAQLSPSSWSAPARAWAEGQGIIVGDNAGDRHYRSFPTREETVQMLYQLTREDGEAVQADGGPKDDETGPEG